MGTIITMVTLTVGSAIGQTILGSQGKETERGYLDLVTKCLLIGTAIGVFVSAIAKLRTIG